MGVTAFPFDAVLDVTPSTLLGNDTATAAPAKALTTTQVRALLGVYTTAQVDALLSGKSDAGHTHAYSSLTGIPATFPPSAHNQAWSTITGTPTTLAGYGITDAAASGHTHPQSDVTGLTSALAAKADLVGGLVPASQLPSFVDDVLEYANLAAFPGTGESGKIYVALDTSRTYRWGGSTYVELTDSTAVWGSISGVLANQTDLASALSGKSDTGHTHAYSSLTGIPSSFAPTAHKATHATGQPDALSPGDIGAVPTARTLTINGTAFDLSADRSWTVAGGISSLNGLTDATQTFATGTTGTNFGIVSTAGVHTFNLPDASATARGVVTTGTQTFAGAKTFSDNLKVGSTSSNYVAVGSGTQDVRYGQNGISNINGGARYDIISWTGGAVIQAIAITGYAYCGLNIQRAGSGTQSWVTVNFSMPATGASDATPREALDVRGNIIADGNLVLHKGTTPTSVTAHNTFTNLSNYERAVLQFVTYASGRYAQLACESAGTGIANMNLVLSPKGTGALIAGAVPDGTAVGGNAPGQYAVSLVTERTAASQAATSSRGVAIGPRATAGGAGNAEGHVAIGYLAQAIGGLSYCTAIGTGAVASYRSTAIDSTASGLDSIAIRSAGASHTSAVAIGFQTKSYYDGLILWGQATANGSVGNPLQSRAHPLSMNEVRTNSSSAAITPVVYTFNEGFRSRQRGIIAEVTVTVLASRSDGAVAKWKRQILIKDSVPLAGTPVTLSILQNETLGTDYSEIPSASVSFTVNSTTRALSASLVGEPEYAVTGDAVTDVLTAVGHPFANGDIVTFNVLNGGAGLTANPSGTYWLGFYSVVNVSGNTFQLAVAGSTSPVINFTSDITAGSTICRAIYWSVAASDIKWRSGAW